jgi:transcriptional regulator with XRE-family HTH domain
MATAGRTQLAALIRAEIRNSRRDQSAVARQAGVSAKHLSEIVNGHSVPSLDLVDRILAVLGRELVLTTRVATRPTPEPVTSRTEDANSGGRVLA